MGGGTCGSLPCPPLFAIARITQQQHIEACPALQAGGSCPSGYSQTLYFWLRMSRPDASLLSAYNFMPPAGLSVCLPACLPAACLQTVLASAANAVAVITLNNEEGQLSAASLGGLETLLNIAGSCTSPDVILHVGPGCLSSPTLPCYLLSAACLFLHGGVS